LDCGGVLSRGQDCLVEALGLEIAGAVLELIQARGQGVCALGRDLKLAVLE
jgi:hypothetical protein